MADTQASVLCSSVCLLKTAIAKVVSDVGSTTANILFDEGAQRSFISKKLANSLKLLPCRNESISLASFGADASMPQCLDVTTVNIVSYMGEMIPLSVLVVPKIAAPLHCITSSKLRELPYLRNLTLAHPIMKEDSQFDISLLIGVDHYWKIVQDHIVRGDGPTAVQSKLGYLLSGPLVHSAPSHTATSMYIGIHSEHGNEDQTLERFWAIESSGKNSDKFMDTYLNSITRQEDGSYVVRFPWKEDHTPLPSNYEVCQRRTRSLVRRLASTPDLMKTYNQIIKEQERRGFVERVSSSSQLRNGQTHYIPHHHVRKESSITPIRIVYDCSCQMSNNYPSLNDCLEVGPPLINDLCSILVVSSLDGLYHDIPIHLWSDSQIVLHWIGNQKKQKLQFVLHRVQEITQTFLGSTWNYCSFGDNPADHLTRGRDNEVLEDPLWMQGPHWLTDKSKWPQWKQTKVSHLQTETTTDTDEAISAERTPQVVSTEQVPQIGIHNVLKISNYSSLLKLLRVTAYLLRFVNNVRNLATHTVGALSTQETNNALSMWIYDNQQTCFHQEYKQLKSKSAKRSSLVRQLQLFLDAKGYIRCGGRIHSAPLSELTKFPFLLPSKHPLTKLIINMIHINQLHGGVNSVITAARQRYWIPSIRWVVRSLLKKCVIRKRVLGRPYSVPDAPPLPKSQTLCSKPFSVTGVDFTGALFVRSSGGERGEQKVYICLFTCVNTRAIHLEVVTDLSEENFIQAFRRFVSRKSLP